jgi:hypothetical protein
VATEAESPRPAERGSDGMTVIPGRARGLRSGQATECWSSEPEHLEESALGGDGDDVHRNIALPAADRGHERGAEGGCSRRRGEARGQITRYSTHMARRRWESRPPSSMPRPADRIVASRAGEDGVPGTSLHVRSPSARHGFASGVPPKTRPRPVARNPGVAPP